MSQVDNGNNKSLAVAKGDQLPMVKIANKPTLRFARPLLAAAISLVYLAIMGMSHPEECFYTKSEPTQPVYSQPAEPVRLISIRSLIGL